MKKTATVLSICLLGASVAQAALIVSPTLNNGSFELDAGGAQITVGDKGDNDLLNWTATPPVSGVANGSSAINKTTWNSKNNGLVSEGDSSAVIGGSAQGLFLDTGYTVTAGDVLTLSLDWFPAAGWDATDHLEIYLYTTDGTVNTVVHSEVLTGFANGAGEQNLVDAVSIAGALSDGKNLLMEVNFSNAGSGEWARVDNVTIDAIPEPAVISLIGIFGGGILISRRLFEKKV